MSVSLCQMECNPMHVLDPWPPTLRRIETSTTQFNVKTSGGRAQLQRVGWPEGPVQFFSSTLLPHRVTSQPCGNVAGHVRRHASSHLVDGTKALEDFCRHADQRKRIYVWKPGVPRLISLEWIWKKEPSVISNGPEYSCWKAASGSRWAERSWCWHCGHRERRWST